MNPPDYSSKFTFELGFEYIDNQTNKLQILLIKHTDQKNKTAKISFCFIISSPIKDEMLLLFEDIY